LGYPESFKNAINAKNNAVQQALTAENQVKTAEANAQMQQQNQQYEAEMSEYLDIFRRHNLAKIASARPGQVELRANERTKEVFDAIEEVSNRISNPSP